MNNFWKYLLMKKASSGADSTLLDGLVAYYTMDSDATDSTDNNHDGTVNGATNTAAKINNGYSFDGNDSISIPNSTDLTFADASGDLPFTFAMWFSVTAFNTNALIAKDDGTNREYALFINSTIFRMFLKDGTNGEQQSTDFSHTLSTGTLYHLICTYDGSGGANAADGINLYVNNSIIAQGYQIKGAYTKMANKSVDMTLGVYATNYHSGLEDEVAIWNRVLTSDERAELYNSSNGNQYPF